MKNTTYKGRVIEYLNAGSAIAAGAIVVLGNFIGVAVAAIAASDSGSLQVEDVIEGLPKTTSQVWTQGQALYYDNVTNHALTTVPTAIFAGWAASAALSAATTGNLKLAGFPVPQAPFVAAVATANATDLATAEALANQLKTSVNAIQAALIAAGLMASS